MSFDINDDVLSDDITLEPDFPLITEQDIINEIARKLSKKEREGLNAYPSGISFGSLLIDISSAEYYRNKGYLSAKEDSLLTWNAMSTLFGIQQPYSFGRNIVETPDKFILILDSETVPSEIRITDLTSQLLVYVIPEMDEYSDFYGSFSDRLQSKPILAFYHNEAGYRTTRADMSIYFNGCHFLGVYKADGSESDDILRLSKVWDKYWLPGNNSVVLTCILNANR